MGLFEELETRRQRGEALDFEKLSDGELERLWWDEDCSDRMIANLFGVSKSRVTARRRRLGLNLRDMCLMKVLSQFLSSEKWAEIGGDFSAPAKIPSGDPQNTKRKKVDANGF